jgi:hypothetical protein
MRPDSTIPIAILIEIGWNALTARPLNNVACLDSCLRRTTGSACSKEGIMKSHLLVSDTRHFRIEYQFNPYMPVTEQPDPEAAKAEHRDNIDAHLALGCRIEYLSAVPENCTRPPAADRAGSRIAGFRPQLA